MIFYQFTFIEFTFFFLLIHQIRKQEADNSAMESTNNSTRMQLVTTESQVTTLEKENSNLRRDKDILTDHVADLQRQVRRNTHCSVKKTCSLIRSTMTS